MTETVLPGLERRLKAQLLGEVRFDRFTRGRYATDASHYQIMPIGVVAPRSMKEAEHALALAREEGVSVLPRGGGTSQAGQTVNSSLVIDCSKYLDHLVELEHVVEIFRAVDDQRGIDGLAGLRGAAAARQHAHAFLARERQRQFRLRHRARRHHADRHDLVVRGVGGVTPARERVELHVPLELRLEPPFEAGHEGFGHVSSRGRAASVATG